MKLKLPVPPLLANLRLDWRAALLFLNLFLIVFAYYLVKPVSRSLLLETGGALSLPYVWTISGVLLLLLVPVYQGLLRRFDRVRVVLGTCMAVVVGLVLFRPALEEPHLFAGVGFYVFVDLFSVVLVEQFWSMTNAVHSRKQGRRWYGVIASGGLVGGLAGGVAAGSLVSRYGIVSEDLLLIAAAVFALMLILTTALARGGLYGDSSPVEALEAPMGARELWTSLLSNRYLMLIAVPVLLSQIAEPIVEYQFMEQVERAYTDRELRTAFLSHFLGLLSGVALGINVLLTPLLLRYAGVLGGLLMQPVLLGAAALSFWMDAGLRSAGAMKVTDRGLAYSINRTARELLYVNSEASAIFRVKAWIDMVGYRTFKIAGNFLILLLTQWLPWTFGGFALSAVVATLCVIWVLVVWQLRPWLTVAGRARAAPADTALDQI